MIQEKKEGFLEPLALQVPIFENTLYASLPESIFKITFSLILLDYYLF